MDFFDEINALNYLFLVVIENLPANRLSITVKGASISTNDEYLTIGDKQLGPMKRIVSDEAGREYKFFFNSYGAYNILNESFSMFQDEEEAIGRLFRIYSKANYLNYIRKNTIVDYTYDYEGTIKQYAINCLDHTIYIVSKDEPIITLIESSN